MTVIGIIPVKCCHANSKFCRCVCVLRGLGVVAFSSNYLSSSLNRLKANFSPLESAGEPCM